MPPTANKGSGGCPTSSYGLICLPPISEELQLIWTQSELTSELDDNEQLIHTFSYFPYPSLPEIALLCLCYGLQMEKVKTWFMVQRIRCGISWSSEEIEETRGRLLRSQDQLHFKPLVAMARRASGRGPLPTEHRATTRDTASSPAAFSSFRKAEVGKAEMIHRPPSLTALTSMANARPPSLTAGSSLSNARPPSLTGLSSLTSARPQSLTGLSSLANSRPPSLTGLSTLANSRPPSLTGLSSLTNTRPPSLSGLSSLTNTRPPSLSSACPSLYSGSVPPLHNSRPPSYTTTMLPLQNSSRSPSYTNAGMALQSNSGLPFYSNAVPPPHNMRLPSYTTTGLPLQSVTGSPYYTSTVSSQHNSRPPSYTNAGPPLQSIAGLPFYASTTPPLQNNLQPPSYTNVGQALQSSGQPYYNSMMQSSQNPRPSSRSSVGLPVDQNTSPPLYTNSRPSSQNMRPASQTSVRPPSYSVGIKEPVLNRPSPGNVPHHLSKRPRTEGDLGNDHPSPCKETMSDSPRPTPATQVSQHRKQLEDSMEQSYRVAERWQNHPDRGIGGSSIGPQQSRECDASTPLSAQSLESHSPSSDKLPSAVAGHMFDVDGTEMSEDVACLPSEEELQKGLESSSWNFDGSFPTHSVAGQGCLPANEDGSYFPIMRRQRKTKEQLTILKSFFLQCQWARREDYQKLEEITGLPRPEIIQWFGDTRYALKHGQLKWFRENVQGCPGWLEQAQQQLQLLDSNDASPSLPATPPSALNSSRNGTPEKVLWKDECPPALSGLPNGRPKETSVVEISSPSPPPPEQSSTPAVQKGYSVLEQYWILHRQIKEGDMVQLVEKSGLTPQQVQDWCGQKAAQPAEVEVEINLDDDGGLEGEEETLGEEEEDGEGEGEREGEEDYDEEEEVDEEVDDDDDDDDVIIQD